MDRPFDSDVRFTSNRIGLNSVDRWACGGGRGHAWLARALLILVFALLFVSTGCEVLTFHRTDFPEEFIGADGQDVLFDDIQAIVTDPNLDPDAKREALRNLGIEDEDLLDSFVGA
ncbi:MAG: hypothetical protein V2A79_11910 [Planctomycetota bacterium]